MTPATATLQFSRKSQTLEELDKERPKSLEAVREILREATTDVETKLSLIEVSLIGRGVTYADFIRPYVAPIVSLMKSLEIYEIYNKKQIEEIIHQGIETGEAVKESDLPGYHMLKECYHKIKEYLPGAFTAIFLEIEKILENLDKYCRSFSKAEEREYMDTPSHYEMKRQELWKLIRVNLDDVKDMIGRYQEDGVDIKMFGIHARDIGRGCECERLPFLLMFPQTCVNVRNACKGIRQWLKADEEYPSYIKDDIIDMEKKIEHKTREERESQMRSSQLEYKMRHVQQECSVLESELKKLIAREMAFNQDARKLEREINKLELEIGTLEQEKVMSSKGLIKSSHPPEALSRKIHDLKEKHHGLATKHSHVQAKIMLVEKKREMLRESNANASALRSASRKARTEHTNVEHELHTMNERLEELKQIYLYKTSHETPKKIFYGLPLAPKTTVKTTGKKNHDPLNRAVKIVAHYIEKDWMKLYRKLPFHPVRGTEMLEQDLDDIFQKSARNTVKELSHEALAKWRRLHTRATLEELKGALVELKRKDVLEHLEKAHGGSGGAASSRRNKPTIFKPARVAVSLPKIKISGDKSMVVQSI
ncbi:uncharacterized protein LOC106160203 [Lingula anatina]|uniref:Uncharacterized protein LOC106160203 n=1 Tax=Lingula anatina TaxID=7574 RepID=A0A1S3I4A2_LINAN|nr:uncharacterized protein LOC106160203 [Lingula anatina]XP_023933544.1 uncharacterized protein LOC106160203 [Lingula anatina]|eukprot:XP_013392194.2 uncharacterized protein LOC106160203 [Lingula anatina]